MDLLDLDTNNEIPDSSLAARDPSQNKNKIATEIYEEGGATITGNKRGNEDQLEQRNKK